MSDDAYLLVEKCGAYRDKPIYVITKHIPASGRYSAMTKEIRCMDLGGEALGAYKAIQGGCSQIQFYNEEEDFRCTRCGQDFSKFYLRQNSLIEVKGLPR